MHQDHVAMIDERPVRVSKRARLLVGSFATVVACVLGLATANWPARAAFPGSNGKIVFTAYSEWGDLALFEIDADGSALTNPTTLSAEGYSPAFSPDGSTIAFMSTRDGNPEIYLIDADGSNLTR
jgi:dipeptidyl aminopeptidase/acylaminoacyl peptidase